MNYESIIFEHNLLRMKCLKLIKSDNGTLMDEFFWLRAAIQEEDISLEFCGDYISCSGHAFTTQTMTNEWFYILIPVEMLREANVGTSN